MSSRKIQRSGTTYYLYLPASWCRQHKITTDSIVHLEKSSKGDLIVAPNKSETNLSSLKLDLNDNTRGVINKLLIAAYINPIKEFSIELKESLSPDQILNHKKLLGGLELVDFDDKTINCQTSIALSDPNKLVEAMIRKILRIAKLMKLDSNHELIQKYEEEVDKTNLLVHKSIISSLMYKSESKLKPIDLFYIGVICRNLEQITDILITIKDDQKFIGIIEEMMKKLLDHLANIKLEKIVQLINDIAKLERKDVADLPTYKKQKIYSLLENISEILCNWYITEIVDRGN